MKEAEFYERLEDDAVKCHLCAHYCKIKPERSGICGVRINHGGTLYTESYGRIAASHVDPIEKKPLYHYLPGSRSFSIGTRGCNLACRFCQNADIAESPKTTGPPREPRVDPQEVVRQAQSANCASIAYTYTEPTIFMEYALDAARPAREQGLGNVFVSNGFMSPEAVEAAGEAIDAANVDLKAFSDEFYRKTCGARLDPVLETIRGLHGAGVHLEATTLIIPGKNDSDEELGEIAGFLASVDKRLPWHISAFRPAHKMMDTPSTPLETLDRAWRIGRDAGLDFVYMGNVPASELNNTRCPACQAVVVDRSRFPHAPAAMTDEGSCRLCGEPVLVTRAVKEPAA